MEDKMHTIIGYDDSEKYDEDYHGLLAHGMMSFYAVDLNSVVEREQDARGVGCEFVPMHQLSNQNIEVPRNVCSEACDDENGNFIGVVRTQEDQEIIFWVTGKKFGEREDGRIQILPSGCYRPNGPSLIGEAIKTGLEKALRSA